MTTALSPVARTISRITPDDGEFHWTDHAVECDEDGPRVAAAQYHTDSDGQGLWVSQPTDAQYADRDGHLVSRVYERHQERAYAQLNLNCSPAALLPKD